MKILAFTHSFSGTPHHAAQLEILEGRMGDGAEIKILYCAGRKTPGCEVNPNRNRLRCFSCVHQAKRGTRLLSPDLPLVPFHEYLADEDFERATAIARDCRNCSQEELRAVVVEGFDLGMGVVSSVISKRRDPDMDPRAHADYIETVACNAYLIYKAVEACIADYGPDEVLLLQGRAASNRAVLRACENAGVNYLIHEAGPDRSSYWQIPNSTPHDISFFHAKMLEGWSDGGDDKIEIGSSYFENLAEKSAVSWMGSFVSRQQEGCLPEGWNESDHNVVIFSSSEDEWAAIDDEWERILYPAQLDGIRQICESLSQVEHPPQLYLRIHPHLAGVDNESVRALSELDYSFLTLIPPDSDISSYALMQACDKVLTFGSTMGIEAVYWKKSSILCGSSFYMHLDGIHKPKAHDDVIEALCDDNLPIPPRESAIRFGYYMLTSGVPFKDTKVTGFEPYPIAVWKGHNLKGNFLIRNLMALRRKLAGG